MAAQREAVIQSLCDDFNVGRSLAAERYEMFRDDLETTRTDLANESWTQINEVRKQRYLTEREGDVYEAWMLYMADVAIYNVFIHSMGQALQPFERARNFDREW